MNHTANAFIHIEVCHNNGGSSYKQPPQIGGWEGIIFGEGGEGGGYSPHRPPPPPPPPLLFRRPCFVVYAGSVHSYLRIMCNTMQYNINSPICMIIWCMAICLLPEVCFILADVPDVHVMKPVQGQRKRGGQGGL